MKPQLGIGFFFLFFLIMEHLDERVSQWVCKVKFEFSQLELAINLFIFIKEVILVLLNTGYTGHKK